MIADNSYHDVFGKPMRKKREDHKKELEKDPKKKILMKKPKKESEEEGEEKKQRKESEKKPKNESNDDTLEVKIEIEEDKIKSEDQEITPIVPTGHINEKVVCRKLKCEKCRLSFKNKKKWKRHIASHPEPTEFVCLVCSKTFSNKKNIYNKARIMKHMIIHDNFKPYKNELWKIAFSQSSKKGCKICGEKFDDKATLKQHNIAKHKAEKLQKCEKCEKVLSERSKLVKHMLKHEIEDGTISVEKLQRHERKRTDCEDCGKSFYSQSELVRHMKGHKGIKEFHCDKCEKSYTSHTSLAQHIDVIHLDKRPFACNECGKLFGRRTSLKIHVLIHTKELPFRCEYCFEGYKEKQILKRHVIKCHPTENKLV